MSKLILPSHLGGHGNKTHIDEGVFNFMITKFTVNSLLDIGCGPGGIVEYALNKGIKAIGVDGDFTLDRVAPCIIHDYTTGPLDHQDIYYDFGWSVEFLEHVEEKYIPNFMNSFQHCRRVILTASDNPRPKCHVNPQLPSYWIKVFTDYGFKYNHSVSEYIKKASTLDRDFFRKSGMYFFNDCIID